MTPPPIRTLTVENYGCIRNATFEFRSGLHALIGPNDSGKSTVLRALRTVMQFAAGTFQEGRRPFAPMLGRGNLSSTIRVSTEDSAYSVIGNDGAPVEEVLEGGNEAPLHNQLRAWNMLSALDGDEWRRRFGALAADLTPPTMVRFDPDSMRAASKLIPETAGIAFFDERGSGLAAVFDAIQNRDVGAFVAIENDVKAHFPAIQKLGMQNTDDGRKQIAVTLQDGTRIGPSALSEGCLYFLGFAALRHVTSSRLFLVEEPENGLHPSRVREVVQVLRKMSETSQIVMATHSPLVVNELSGDEVTVVTRTPEEGTQGKLLSQVPGYEDAMKVYQPGEFWLSYADGDTEAALLNGTARA